MNHLQRAGCRKQLILSGSKELTSGNRQDRSESLAACKEAVAHRLVDNGWIGSREWRQSIEPAVDQLGILIEEVTNIHFEKPCGVSSPMVGGEDPQID